MREIEIETKAKQPDASLAHIEPFDELFSEELLEPKLEVQVGKLGVCGPYVEQRQQWVRGDESSVVGFIHLVQKHPSLNVVQKPNSMDSFLTTEHFSELNLAHEQTKDPDIQEVLRWKEANTVPFLRYAHTTLRKYAKHFTLFVVKHGVLYRQFFDAVGAVQVDQFCVPKHLWQEIFYRLHNSATAGHLGIIKTIHEFRKDFTILVLLNIMLTLPKNVLHVFTSNEYRKNKSVYR